MVIHREISVICFTETGRKTAGRIARHLRCENRLKGIWCKKKPMANGEALSDAFSCQLVEGTLTDWTKERFTDSDAILFVGATGIAVRAIAPYVSSKVSDPAILCIDEQGRFVISLLSGHLGGANELAAELAEVLDAIPVITTATDLNRRFAVDVFARNNHLAISDMTLAKAVSAALLDHRTVGFFSTIPVEGSLPIGLTTPEKADSGLTIAVVRAGENPDGQRKTVGLKTFSDYRQADETGKPDEQVDIAGTVAPDNVLYLSPRDIVLGVGCRKGKEKEIFEAFLLEQLSQQGISLTRVDQICSIDLKAQEGAILAFSRKYHLPYQTFSTDQLLSCPGSFSASAFVAQTTGVDNVCERSAVMGSKGGKLVLKKTARDGMTLAIAQRTVETLAF